MLSYRQDGEKVGNKMKLKGYYVWCRNIDGSFSTIFLPTTDYDVINKYFKDNSEFECLATLKDYKNFNENEKEELFNLIVELNNL